MSLRDEILSKKIELREETYHWKYFDKDVLIRELTQTDIDKLARLALDTRTRQIKDNYTAAKIIASVKDPATGKALFLKTDLEFLSGLPASATTEVSQKIEEINGMTPEDVDDAAKNCYSSPERLPG